MSFRTLLETTCTLQNPTYEDSTDFNTRVPTYPGTQSTLVPCRFESSADVQEENPHGKVVSAFRFWCMPDQTVKEDTRVVIDSTTYLVTKVESQQGGQAHHIKALLREIETL